MKKIIISLCLITAAIYFPQQAYGVYYTRPNVNIKFVDSNTTAEQYLQKALANEKLGNITGAISDCSDAIRRDSNYVPAYMNRARLYNKNGNFLAASADYGKVLRLEPTNYEALYQRAETYRKTRNDMGAISDYNKLIDKNYRTADAYVGRGLVNYNMKRYSYTLKDLEKALELYPENSEKYNSTLVLIKQIQENYRPYPYF